MNSFLSVLVLTVLEACVFVEGDQVYKRLVCYFDRAGTQRLAPYDITPEDVDPFLCSHIIYGHVSINDKSNGVASFDLVADADYFKYFTSLKKINPRLAILLGVGGSTQSFRALADNPINREAFAHDVKTLLRANSFDGIDLDWRFPEGADRVGFASLVKDMWELFDFEAVTSGRRRLMISAVISASAEKFYNYDITTLSSHLDMINLLSIDYEQANKTALNSALRGPNNNPKDIYNQNWIIRQLIVSGVPATNINLGVATYARCYRLCNTMNTGIGASTCGQADPGLYTRKAGSMAFYEVCQNLNMGWNREWSLDQLGPFAYQTDQWCSYDDVDSLSYKVNFVNMFGIGGITVWDLSQDDFRGLACQHGKFPLVGSINRMFNLPSYHGIVKPNTPEVAPGQRPVVPVPADPSIQVVTLNPPQPSTVKKPVYIEPSMLDPTAPGFKCITTGTFYYPNSKNCRKYFECSNGFLTSKNCPANQRYNTNINSCVYDNNMEC